MSIHLIIDGYNVIRQSAELARLDARDLQEGPMGLKSINPCSLSHICATI